MLAIQAYAQAGLGMTKTEFGLMPRGCRAAGAAITSQQIEKGGTISHLQLALE